MPSLATFKIAAIIAALVALIAAYNWHIHSIRVDQQMKDEAKLTTFLDAVDHENAQIEAAHRNQMQQLVAKYEAKIATPDPIATGLAGRLRNSNALCRGTVPKAATPASSAGSVAAQSAGDEEAQRLLDEVFQAARADALELEAIQQAWPR